MTFEIHQGYLPTAIGRVAELHARYYSALVGFGLPFEAKVAREMAEFCERYDKARDGLWLLLQDGRVEGSIAIDGARAAEQGAHLRWFITSDLVRGTGAGTALPWPFANLSTTVACTSGLLRVCMLPGIFTARPVLHWFTSSVARSGVAR